MNVVMNVTRTKHYRVIVAVVFGLIGFGVNFFDLRLLESPTFKISILAGLFFPLVIALAWGWRYGLLSALAGGCQTMWWLWWNDGWGILYSVPVLTLWIVWHGWWADRRRERDSWRLSCFTVEIPFRLVFELGYYTVFAWLVSFNPPPWNPTVTETGFPLSWFYTIVIKHVITGYILLLLAYVALSLGPVRRFFGLRPCPAQYEITSIYAGAILLGVFLWLIDSLAGWLVFYPGNTFWGAAIFDVNPHELFMRLLFVIVSLSGAAVIARLVRRRALLGERLDYLNRILTAIRNVNQLITHEKDRTPLLHEACRLLIETSGFYNAWVVLVEDDRCVEPFYQAGFNGDFEPLAEQLRGGSLPRCARMTLESGGVHVIDDPLSQCPDCPLASRYAGRVGMTVRLEHEGRVFGCLAVSIPREFAQDREEQSLFEEVAGDISFALWSMETEAQRRSIEREYAAVLDSTRDAVLAVDLEGKILLFNPSAETLFRCSAEEARGTSISRLCPEDRREEQADILRRVRETGSIQGFETVRLTADGRSVPVEITVSVCMDAQGRPIGFNGILRDITERKLAEAERDKLEAQLRQAQKMEAIGRLATGVAHDFNNQLQVVLGYCELLLSGRREGDPLWESIMQIRRAADHARSTTSHLLAFGQQQVLKPKVVNVANFLHEIEKPVGRMIGEDVKFVTAVPPGVSPLFIDRSGLHQAIMNLVVNARDAMPQGGKLTLHATNVTLEEEQTFAYPDAVAGDYVLLEVIDTGVGMDPEILDCLFEPFFTTKEQGEGTGLGLPMVQGFIRQSNGFLRIDSRPGEGTTVRLLLPPAKVPSHAEADGAKKSRFKKAQYEATILVVEDEDNVRAYIIEVLRKAGYRVLSAGTPSEAMRRVQSEEPKPDLVVSDVVMPEMRGDELAERLESIHKPLRFLFMSGYTDIQVDKHEVMRKPFQAQEFLARVRDLLPKRPPRGKK